ncbi:hypothetical protein [Psychroserpens luteus]|uniref:Uncharacterized protein n=1 Tax=Psychroserpens luteus TaxID=1434066 RepID=A0ABW5ZUC9_9FLAO|nr:hypothetical protein [Psychroserpens luteus]
MKTLILIMLILTSTVSFSQVGIGTTTPQSTLDINGNLSVKVVNLNGGNFANKTPIDDGTYVNLNPNNGGVNSGNDFILPDANAFPGRIYILRNRTDFDPAYIYTAGGDIFTGDSRTAITQPYQMESDNDANGGSPSKTIMVISDGDNWTFGFFNRN